jgi:superfamily II DNA or RNA helicase
MEPDMGSAAGAVATAAQTRSRPLRAWQRAALARYEEQFPKDFLVTATPGAGKTTFALTLAQRLLTKREVARVIVVCPTDHLRMQWADAADALGIVLDPNLTNAVGPVRPGTAGYVTTYAQVAGKPMLHAARATTVKTLVILDEVHHAGDGLSWGEAVEEAFGRAARRLCLTGTPFRTKADERIPFVRYVEDSWGGPGRDGELQGGLMSVADFTYGYKEALADSVVRPVVFAAYTGTSRWRNSAGEVVAASLSEAGTRSVEMQAWRTALDPKGQWVPHVIAAMDDRITHLRETGMPDAAGLVLASDQDDAREYAKIVRRVTGKAPELILSDDPKASKKIEKFNLGGARIAVCVRMVSEGVDVPRAAVLAWMTSYRTPLFFAQAVGRVVRARGPHESATVFLPAVRPLLSLAASMEEERNHVMSPPKTQPDEELEELDLPPREPREGALPQWEALEADARFAHVLHSGTAHTGEGTPPTGAPLEAEDEDFLGIPGLLTAAQTAELLSKRDDELRIRVAASHRRGDDGDGFLVVEDHPEEPMAGNGWRDVAELRREINRLVNRISAKTSTPQAVVHTQLRQSVPGPPSASASVDVLRARRERLRTML